MPQSAAEFHRPSGLPTAESGGQLETQSVYHTGSNSPRQPEQVLVDKPADCAIGHKKLRLDKEVPMKHLTIVLTLLLLVAAGQAEAAYNAACAEDANKLCKDILPGGGRVTACLKAREAELSTACKDSQAEMQWRFRRAPDECSDDVVRFCSNVRAVDRRIVRCLLQNERELSVECQKKLTKED
jgi:hypothetical protein